MKPDCTDYTENLLSEECRLIAGLDLEQVKGAQPLDQVLDEVKELLLDIIYETQYFLLFRCLTCTLFRRPLLQMPITVSLLQIERFFKSKGIHPELGGDLFCMCSDGPHHFRLCLHPEAMLKNLRLKPYFFQYFDLRKEFQKMYKNTVSSIQEMLECIHSSLLFISHAVNFFDPGFSLTVKNRFDPGC